MYRFAKQVAVTFLLVGSLAFSQTAAKDAGMTVDEVIAKNIKAMGGYDKIKALKSIRMKISLMVQGLELPGVIEEARPNKQRLDITFQGMVITQSYDGKTAWQTNPLQGMKDPSPMGEVESKEMADDADVDGPFIDYKDKGNKVELIGKEDVEGSPTYKLKVTLKSGSVRYIFLDTDSFLEVHSESKRTIRGTEVTTISNLGDYKEVDGLMFPFSLEQGSKDSQQKQKFVVTSVELNPTIDPARFTMPEVKKDDKIAPDAKPADAKTDTKKPDEKKPPFLQ